MTQCILELSSCGCETSHGAWVTDLLVASAFSHLKHTLGLYFHKAHLSFFPLCVFFFYNLFDFLLLSVVVTCFLSIFFSDTLPHFPLSRISHPVPRPAIVSVHITKRQKHFGVVIGPIPGVILHPEVSDLVSAAPLCVRESTRKHVKRWRVCVCVHIVPRAWQSKQIFRSKRCLFVFLKECNPICSTVLRLCPRGLTWGYKVEVPTASVPLLM